MREQHPMDFDGASFPQVPLEAVREYWDRRPCNIRHSPAPVGSRQYFDEVEKRRYLVEPHIWDFAEFDRWKGAKVLEIGCGIGTDTINFARAGAYVTAVDVSPHSVRLAQERAGVYGLGNRIKYFVADAENLSDRVQPESYDLVYSFGVVHHTPHPEGVIAQIREHYVQPGSVLKLMVYHRHAWKVLGILATHGKWAFWKVDELVAKYSEAQTGCPITYTFSRSDVRRLLGPAFDIDEIEVRHIFPYRVSDYVNYRYVKAWHFRYLPAPVFQWLQGIAGWHLCVTAKAR